VHLKDPFISALLPAIRCSWLSCYVSAELIVQRSNQRHTPNSHRRDVNVAMRAMSRQCEWSRRQSATVCGNLEQSKQSVIDRIISSLLHSWNLGQPMAGSGGIAAVVRLGLSVQIFRTCSDFRFSDDGSLQSSRIQFTPPTPMRRDATAVHSAAKSIGVPHNIRR